MSRSLGTPAAPAAPRGPAGADGHDGIHGTTGPAGPAGSADTAAQVLAKILTVDGTGSGLDADLLDGLHATAFATPASLAAAIGVHEADTTAVHGIADTAALVLTSDGRLSNARTPTAHAASHASAGADAITISESQVTGLTAALAAKLATAGGTVTGPLSLGTGTLAAAGALRLSAGTLPVDGVLFGTDTNLYRSAADSLKTDDAFRVGANITFQADGRASIGHSAVNPQFVLTIGGVTTFASATTVNGLVVYTTNSGAGSMVGIMNNVLSTNPGTVNELRGYTTNVRIANATGIVTYGYDYYAESPILSAGAAIGIQHGVYIAAQKITGVTTGYSIYQAGVNDLNYFNGALVLGVNAAASGTVRLPNGAWLTARNSTNSGDLNLMRADAANGIVFGVARTGTPAAATDPATTMALVNDLRVKLVASGLIS